MKVIKKAQRNESWLILGNGGFSKLVELSNCLFRSFLMCSVDAQGLLMVTQLKALNFGSIPNRDSAHASPRNPVLRTYFNRPTELSINHRHVWVSEIVKRTNRRVEKVFRCLLLIDFKNGIFHIQVWIYTGCLDNIL